jgi:superfamily I DNA and RNA helicase
MESPVLSSKNALKRHLCILIQVAGDEKPVIVVIFLWKGDDNTALRREAQEKALYNQQTWSSYNRRLRFHFKEFIQTDKGKELFDLLFIYFSM